MSTPPEKPPRKFPAPCWTQEETLALIDAYRERWYALRRGYLRTAEWDAVAAAVAVRCPNASPSKTSAQCRHKMEKLRQRYRTEKQRSLSFPGRFFSSWFFFDNMESMENGPPPLAVGSNHNADNRVESSGGLRIKSLGDRNLVESVSETKNCKKIDGNSNPNLGIDQDGVDPGGGFRAKAIDGRNSVTFGFREKNSSKIDGNPSPNVGSRIMNGYSSYLDDGSDEDVGDDTYFGGGFRIPPVFRGKKFHGNFGPNFYSNHDEGGGFCVKTPNDLDLVPPGYKAKKFGKVDGKLNPNFAYIDGGFCVKIVGDGYSVPTGFRSKSFGKTDGNSCANLDYRVLNGFSSTSGLGLGKKRDGGGVKRERDSIAEMVSSIKLLGEGFMKMEKMKMEMAREIEKMRMETEMKRNELILESQRQIVDAFVTVLRESKKKKVNTTVPPES